MPTTSEATRLNLEYYKKQAKALLKAYRSGDPASTERILVHLPQGKKLTQAQIGLQETQFVIAREQGFPSWTKLKTHIEQSQMTLTKQADEFVCSVCSDNFQRAKALWEGNPAIAGASPYVALVTGDFGRVEKWLATNTTTTQRKGGPNDWEPLVYVCFSRWARIAPEAAGGLVKTAKLLLSQGADPNGYHINKFWPDSPLPCLYGASAATNQIELTQLLLQAGADPNDGESLFHCIDHKDRACFRLLLDYVSPAALPPVLKHMLDYEDLEGVKLLLNAGADPNQADEKGESALHCAVWRGRSPEIVTALLDAGAKIDAARADGRTAFELAVCTGQQETANLLRKRGADTSLTQADRLIGSVISLGHKQRKTFLSQHPELRDTLGSDGERMVPDLAANHMTSAVAALLDAGLPIDAKGSMDGATALHAACLNGYADLVDLLLERGASLTAEDDRYQGTPVGWFAQGARNGHCKDGDYAETARLLIKAGAAFSSYHIPTGDDSVDAVFREQGLLA
ncbi:MAG TPA: ankyrin repeat domain-containing protein [Hyphomicrobiales bacterium]|nr:ankyrin repeat domain-containing protein [Hyphomicrobiales bacterium]